MKLVLSIILLIYFLSTSYVYGVETFTPIFCNDYEFTCCGGKIYSSQSYTVSDEVSWKCPDYAYKCKVLSSEGKQYMVGSQNCALKDNLVYTRMECTDEQVGKTEMQPEDIIYLRNGWFDISGNVEIKIIKPQLGYCGRSGSVGEETTCGVPVSGADGCKFSPTNNIVYTSTSSLNGKQVTYSYVVPIGGCVLAFQSGDRHICGYKEESCTSDSDCSDHTYGNKECIGRSLQTYGCRSYGTPVNGGDRGPFDNGWGNDKQQPSESGDADFGNRCEIVSSTSVECCGDNDCGSNYFCDKSTYTCKENVQCRIDSDCGVSVQCDSYNKKLKKPICSSGKCGFEEKTVECCSGDNCQNGGYCDENKCKGGEASLATVPKSNNTNMERGGNSSSGNSSGGGIVIIVIILLVVGGTLGWFLLNKNKEHKVHRESITENSKGQSKKHCTECGNQLKHQAEFCTNCGKKQDSKIWQR